MFKPKELFILGYSVPLSGFRLAETENQSIIACPEPPAEAVKAGKAISVPRGEFDVELILEKIPNTFQPELVILTARNMKFMPRGIEKFPCPKVMKIGDTFHSADGSLTGIIEYCRALQCDYHWLYQGVQHLHFFVEAGLKNVFWLPGTLVIENYIPHKSEQKLYDVIFRGSQSEYHFYRSKLLKWLQKSQVNIDINKKPYIESLEDYTKSHIVINCSLNGDTNRRIFEVLMAGGFLLTDRLSLQSGLFSLFQEGVHLECYGSEYELLEKIEFYLKHPDKAEKIASAGHQKLINYYSQKIIAEKFYHYIFKGEMEQPFLLGHDQRACCISQIKDEKQFCIRLEVYELIQEIHRLNSRIKLLYYRGTNRELLSDLADLPRLDITYVNSPENLAEIEAWCARVGVGEQVDLQKLSASPQEAQKFQIVMVDLPNTMMGIKQMLSEVEPHLDESALLLVVGNAAILTRETLNLLTRLSKFSPISLCEANSYDELGIGACLVYQKLTAGSQGNLATSKLFVSKLSLKAKVSKQLYSIPVINWVKKLIIKPSKA
jgi:Glycosyl transferases group 1